MEPVRHLARMVVSSLRISQHCVAKQPEVNDGGSWWYRLLDKPTFLTSLRWRNGLIFKSIWACKWTNFNRCHFFLFKPKLLLQTTFTSFFSVYVNTSVCSKQNTSPLSTISVSTLPRLRVPQLLFCFSLGPVMFLNHNLSSTDLFLFAVSSPYVRLLPLHGDMIPHSISKDLLILLAK